MSNEVYKFVESIWAEIPSKYSSWLQENIILIMIHFMRNMGQPYISVFQDDYSQLIPMKSKTGAESQELGEVQSVTD